jgi:hypothetical protein
LEGKGIHRGLLTELGECVGHGKETVRFSTFFLEERGLGEGRKEGREGRREGGWEGGEMGVDVGRILRTMLLNRINVIPDHRTDAYRQAANACLQARGLGSCSCWRWRRKRER